MKRKFPTSYKPNKKDTNKFNKDHPDPAKSDYKIFWDSSTKGTYGRVKQ